MPATASTAQPGPAASLRPSQAQPHANGPSRSMAQGTPAPHHRMHKYSNSADAMDSRPQKSSQHNSQLLSKPLPSRPEREEIRISRPTQMTEAERYKTHSMQKFTEKDSPATPSSYGHNSLSSSSHGHSSSSQQQFRQHPNHHGHTYSSSHGHAMTAASQSPGSSMGRHRSATVAGPHGGSTTGNGLDTSTSSSSSAQGHSKLRRKPVRALEDTPSEHFKWEPGSEPMLMSPTDEVLPTITGSGRSRNRSVALYRDAPGSATLPPMNGQGTLSRATGASAASSTKTLGQPHYVLKDPDYPAYPSTSLGRHHSASVSIPPTATVGSSRTTVQTFFPNAAADASASSNQKQQQQQDKLVYRASSSNGHGGNGSGSANSSTPTPKANAFAGANTPTPSSQVHAHNAKAAAYKLTIPASELATNATTAPAASSHFSIPMMNSSSDEHHQQQQHPRHRGRKDSHRRTTSASTSAGGHAMSPSTASASTEGSSHEGDGSELWKSGTSLSQMSQTHASMGPKRGQQAQAQQHQAQAQQQTQQQQQHSRSQQRIPQQPTPQKDPHYRRSRGNSDAPAPQSHYRPTAGPGIVALVHLNSRSSKGSRPTTGSGHHHDDDDDDDERERGRGRTKEKDTSFMGRVRARSNSLTKSLSKVIQYPIYLAKGGSKRESKRLQHNAAANGSNGAFAYSDSGHSNAYGGRISGDEPFDYPYPASASTTTTSTTAASPVSNRHPAPGGGGGAGGNGNLSKSSVNILPAQHLHTSSKKITREHKRSLSAQPALGYELHAGGLSPPPPPRHHAVVPSAFQRLKKPLSAKEREQRDMNRASPMTRAKNDILQMWDGVEIDPRRSGIAHAQVQISQSRIGGEGVVFPSRERGEMREYPPAVPFAQERLPRRR